MELPRRIVQELTQTDQVPHEKSPHYSDGQSFEARSTSMSMDRQHNKQCIICLS